MSKDDATIKDNLKNLLNRLSTAGIFVEFFFHTYLFKLFFITDKSVRQEQLAVLIERLESQFSGDIGCFSVYFLNKLTLQTGQSLYLGPNEPHAYLSGSKFI